MGAGGRGRTEHGVARAGALVLLALATACAGAGDDDVTPDACEGALTDLRVNVPLECDNLGYLVKEAGRQGGIEIILAPGAYFVDADLALKNGTHFRGEQAGDPPVVQVSGVFSVLNSLVEDVIIDGELEARQSEIRRVSAARTTLQDTVAAKLETATLIGSDELDLTDVTATERLELSAWGRLARVTASAGAVELVGETSVAGSRLPAVTVRPDGELRDRIDIGVSETTILGPVTAHAGTGGTVYVNLSDSDLHGIVVDSTTKGAGVEIALLRSTVSGSLPVILDIKGADNFSLTLLNTLVHSGSKLMATHDAGLGLARDVQLTVHNSVLIGGTFEFRQEPDCAATSATSLSLRNNIFVDVDFDLQLLEDQLFDASHNLFMDAGCRSCLHLPADTCEAEVPGIALGFLESEGSIIDDAGFVALDVDDPGAADLRLDSGSPAIDAGVPEWSDADGSRSDMGLYGGPDGEP